MIEKDVDFEFLNNIFKEYKDNYNFSKSEFLHNYIYKINNDIIGFILYTSIYENIEIIDFFVNNNYRNKKIGFNLINELIKDNKEKNITLEVNINNKIAINLYKKVGFEVVTIRKGYYKGIDGYLMYKSRC